MEMQSIKNYLVSSLDRNLLPILVDLEHVGFPRDINTMFFYWTTQTKKKLSKNTLLTDAASCNDTNWTTPNWIRTDLKKIEINIVRNNKNSGNIITHRGIIEN